MLILWEPFSHALNTYFRWPCVHFVVLDKGVAQLFRRQICPFPYSVLCLSLGNVHVDAKKHEKGCKMLPGEAGRGCFFFWRVSKYAYALHFIGTLHPSVQKLHYEQQPRQNVRCLCPCWAHKRTLNWVIQWQVRKDVTGVLEQGDTLALQKSALWVNNVPCYQFGHAAKVNVKTHWSTHSSAFAAANRAAERKQVSFLHCNNRRNRAADGDDPGQICRYVW